MAHEGKTTMAMLPPEPLPLLRGGAVNSESSPTTLNKRPFCCSMHVQSQRTPTSHLQQKSQTIITSKSMKGAQ